MRIVKKVGVMQRVAAQWRREGLHLAFVPTMGYLHEGHLSLVREARKSVGRRGKVVLSIYVNPTQFGPAEDFSRYPRDFARDEQLCRGAGVDAVFAPDNKEMYPVGAGQDFSTYVVEESLSRNMEGASRPSHFRGVTTIVAKLFNIVQPQTAIFGAKDYQQAAIVQRMVRDLNFPVRIIVAPTHREADGLAMSSRNKYLEGELRAQAGALWRAIQQARKRVLSSSAGLSAASLRSELKRLIEREPDAKVDYIEFFDPHTLGPVSVVKLGAHVALAVFVGKTRLIDNSRLM